MWKHMQEDGIRARRLIMVAGVGLVSIGQDDESWYAYPNDDYINRIGLVCWIGLTEQEVINSAREEERYALPYQSTAE